MNKFEQLIEYVINDEEEKARTLFHDIVVEKSRNIYEEIMAQEEEEDEDDDIDESMGDAADDLIDDIEADEEGVSMEGEEEDEDEDEDEDNGEDDYQTDQSDMSDDEELEDRVVDLEDKLDELMAEFEELMGGNEKMDDMDDMDNMDNMDNMAGDEEIEIDDTELETGGMMEAISLKSAPAPVKHEDGNTNKKSIVAANSGATGMAAKPVSEKSVEEKGRSAPQAKEIIGKVGNTPAQSTQKPSAAPKATTAEPGGINTKSITR